MRIIAQGRVEYVHMGPPCGTASRAREKRVPKWLRDRGAPDPQPLRSNHWPRGLPALANRPVDLAKVRTANAIYDFCVNVAWRALSGRLRFHYRES